MLLAEDQHATQELAAQGAGQALADRVHPRRLHSGAQDPGTGGLEDGVERGGEVRSAVADQEFDVLEPLGEGEGEVAGLLGRSLAGGVGGDAAQMHAAGAVLDEHQDVQSLQQHGVHVEEVDGEDPGRLGAQELQPGRACVAGSRIDARLAQDLPDCGLRDRHAGFGYLAVDPAVSPQRILLRQPDDDGAMLGTVAGRPGLRRLPVSYLPGASLRCQASSVAGVTGKTPVQRSRGMSRASAANHTRSAGS